VRDLGRADTQPGRQSWFSYRVLRGLSPETLTSSLLERMLAGQQRGGMAEKVAHERDGLHFRAGDARSLAATIRRAVETPGLWGRLRAGIRPVRSLDEHIAVLAGAYEQLIEQRRTVLAA